MQFILLLIKNTLINKSKFIKQNQQWKNGSAIAKYLSTTRDIS